MKKTLYCKFVGGNLGGDNLITSTSYEYDDQTFKYLGSSSLYDGGDKAKEEGYYTFNSVKAFIESKGKEPLVKITDGRLS